MPFGRFIQPNIK